MTMRNGDVSRDDCANNINNELTFNREILSPLCGAEQSTYSIKSVVQKTIGIKLIHDKEIRYDLIDSI